MAERCDALLLGSDIRCPLLLYPLELGHAVASSGAAGAGFGLAAHAGQRRDEFVGVELRQILAGRSRFSGFLLKPVRVRLRMVVLSSALAAIQLLELLDACRAALVVPARLLPRAFGRQFQAIALGGQPFGRRAQLPLLRAQRVDQRACAASWRCAPRSPRPRVRRPPAAAASIWRRQLAQGPRP